MAFISMGWLVAFGAAAMDSSSIYHDGWIDFNKDGKKDVYEDPSQPINKRVNDLLKRMTLEEKVGQLWQSDTPRTPTKSWLQNSRPARSAPFLRRLFGY